MNIKNLALFSGALLLAGCPSGPVTTTDVPTDTGTDTDVTPVLPDPFEWNITLADGDGVADTAGVVDADTMAVETKNSVANFSTIIEWEFGVAQTASANGWIGEDCDGITDPAQGERCHLMDPDTTMVLTRVGTIGAIVPGSTTLINIDSPPESTPGMTYVIYGYDSADATVECFVYGHSVAYYASTGCDTYVPAM